MSVDGLVMPPATLSLPDPITGVWLASTLSFKEALGVRWNGQSWSAFRTRGPGIEDEPPELTPGH
jgi:hypothetical protein